MGPAKGDKLFSWQMIALCTNLGSCMHIPVVELIKVATIRLSQNPVTCLAWAQLVSLLGHPRVL
jgi:hypothetical protein